MKKRLATIIILVFVLMIMTALAMPSNTVTAMKTHGDLTYSVYNGEASILECDPSVSGELIIPEKINGYPVTSINSSAFFGRGNLTNIVIPDSVERIGSYAFSGCTGLTSVNIGNGVTKIEDRAFNGCTSLTSVSISASVEQIHGLAFSDCRALTSVYIDSSTVVSNLQITYQVQNGHFIYNAKSIMIEQSVANVPSYVTDNFPHIGETTHNGKQYVSYTKHEFGKDWTFDETGHWYSCADCDVKKDSSSHVYVGFCRTACSECGYVHINPTHFYMNSWRKDGTSHWCQCYCGLLLKDVEDHTWDAGKVMRDPDDNGKFVRVYECTVCRKIKYESIDPDLIFDDDGNLVLSDLMASSSILITLAVCVIVLFSMNSIHAVALVGAIVLYIMNLIKKKKNKRSHRPE